jgi:hypothetical protein
LASASGLSSVSNKVTFYPNLRSLNEVIAGFWSHSTCGVGVRNILWCVALVGREKSATSRSIKSCVLASFMRTSVVGRKGSGKLTLLDLVEQFGFCLRMSQVTGFTSAHPYRVTRNLSKTFISILDNGDLLQCIV